MDKKESFYWDIVKGTAIFLMLWSHCIQYCAMGAFSVFGKTVFKIIYAFHMPVLMLVSGYLFYHSFRKRNLNDLLVHRIQGMLQPIIMATVLNNVLMLIPRFILSNHADVLFGSLFEGIERDLWFLWAVLYCSVIVGFCCKWTDRPVLQAVLVILGAFAVLLVPQWDMTLFMYPYFAVGFFCGMYRQSAKRIYQVIKYAALVIFPVMMLFYEKKHYIYITPMFSEELGLAASMEIALFRWAIGFVGSIWMLTIMEFLLSLGSRISLWRRCLEAVSWMGRNSLQVYCLSVSLLSGYLPHLYRKFTELIGGNIFAENELLYDYLFMPVLAAVWAAGLCCMVLLLKKTRLHKLIFGR